MQPDVAIQEAVVRIALVGKIPLPIRVRIDIEAEPEDPCSSLWQSKQYVTRLLCLFEW